MIRRKSIAGAGSRRTAFTLVELLVVIGIIALLAAILLPAIRAAFLKADKNKAEIETRSIKNAVQAFLNDYGKLPVPKNDQGGTADKIYDDSKTVIRALTANETGAEIINTRKITYLESQTNSVDGTYLDPWDKQYKLILDVDYNNKVVYDYDAKTYGTVCIAVSAGPDGQWKTTDDIPSSK